MVFWIRHDGWHIRYMVLLTRACVKGRGGVGRELNYRNTRFLSIPMTGRAECGTEGSKFFVFLSSGSACLLAYSNCVFP